jgi:hypothetical protein
MMELKDRVEKILSITSRCDAEYASEFRCIWEYNKPKGLRNTGGYLLWLTHPNKYSGQEERYQKESKETMAFSELLAELPGMIELIKDQQARIEELEGALKEANILFNRLWDEVEPFDLPLENEIRDVILKVESILGIKSI